MIHDALNFPADWEIEKISSSDDFIDISVMLISGDDFPEISNDGVIEEVTIHSQRGYQTAFIKLYRIICIIGKSFTYVLKLRRKTHR